jgi:hypothetical protein
MSTPMNHMQMNGIRSLAGAAALLLAAAALAASAEQNTPRFSDGHPDLSGNWDSPSGGNFAANITSTRTSDGSVDVGRGGAANGPAAGGAARPRGAGLRGPRNIPPYKTPELLAKADALYADGHHTDLVVDCGQPGLLRVGAPQKIVQTRKEIIFLYADLSGMVWRVVRTDGSPHHPDVDPSFYGDSIGHWEDDTLVIHTNSLIDEIWMGEYGYLHSDKLNVTERLKRQGKTMTYEVTVEDPEMLSKPWVKAPVAMTYSDVPLEEPVKCVVIPDPTAGHHEQRIP